MLVFVCCSSFWEVTDTLWRSCERNHSYSLLGSEIHCILSEEQLNVPSLSADAATETRVDRHVTVCVSPWTHVVTSLRDRDQPQCIYFFPQSDVSYVCGVHDIITGLHEITEQNNVEERLNVDTGNVFFSHT